MVAIKIKKIINDALKTRWDIVTNFSFLYSLKNLVDVTVLFQVFLDDLAISRDPLGSGGSSI